MGVSFIFRPEITASKLEKLSRSSGSLPAPGSFVYGQASLSFHSAILTLTVWLVCR